MESKIIIPILIAIVVIFLTIIYLNSLSGQCTILKPCIGEELLLCDLDFDKDCDNNDFNIFKSVIGECEDGGRYNEPADANHDGCITLKDQEILFPNEP